MLLDISKGRAEGRKEGRKGESNEGRKEGKKERQRKEGGRRVSDWELENSDFRVQMKCTISYVSLHFDPRDTCFYYALKK